MQQPILQLDTAGLQHACDKLARSDARLGAIVQRFGYPPLWDRKPGFATLVHIILEQQVSLASALAALNKLKALTGPLTPARFLALDDAQLLGAGFSRQKARYCRLLAEAIERKTFVPGALARMRDDDAKAALTALTGIGDWTADIYLLMVLCRPDVWPKGDLALWIAAQEVLELPTRPTPEVFVTLGEPWRPHRSAAARLLWHHYLSVRKRA
jgi:DNA-3-methyladenine glycosylase II